VFALWRPGAIFEAYAGYWYGEGSRVVVLDDRVVIWEIPWHGTIEGFQATDSDMWAFLHRMQALMASLKARYCDPLVLDGVTWSLRMAVSEDQLSSQGSNAFPPSWPAIVREIEDRRSPEVD